MNLKLREEYSRLFYPKELSVMIESYKYITDVAFNIIHEHGKIGVKSDLEEDANLLFQLTL